MRNSILFVLTCGALGASALSGDQGAQPEARERPYVWPTLASVRVEQGPEVDGRLLDKVWELAPANDDFVQLYPAERVAPSQRTVVRVLHDADNLYVGAWLYDSEPQRIVAKQMIQGRTYDSDDRFAVSLDTFGDRRNGYFFQLNGNGVRREALLGQQSWNEDWDAIWEGGARITEEGLTLEFAIPFKSLSFDPARSTWGINFSRVIPRSDEAIYWSAPGQRDYVESPAFFGHLEGMEGLRQGRGLDIVPSLVASSLSADASGEDSSSLEPALDVFYKPVPGVTAALTVNTDFSATEVDNRQINLDRFSLFFPEKRDFFLQDAGIFDFSFLGRNGRPFFSRRIGLDEDGRTVPLEVGAKVSGRRGRMSFGLLGIRQGESTGLEAATLGVGRLSFNLLEESSVGLLLTEGDPTSDVGNRLAAADFHYRDSDGWNGKAIEADVFYQRSDTQGASGDDKAYGLQLRYPNDRWFAFVRAYEIGEDFHPGLGFANRTGIRNVEAELSRRVRPTRGFIRNVHTGVFHQRVTDTQGALQTQWLYAWNRLESATDDSMQWILVSRKEAVLEPFEIFEGIVIQPGSYDWEDVRLFLGLADHRPLSIDFELIAGGFFDGQRRRVGTTLEWRQSKHVFLSAAYFHDDFELEAGRFIARVATLRADFAFTAAFSWSNLIQFDNVSDSVGFNSRLRWNPRAGRDVYLVINQGYDVTPANRLVGSDTALTAKAAYTIRF